MSKIKVTSIKLDYLVDEYLNLKFAQDVGMSALKGDPNVPDEFYIGQIQKFLMELPWTDLDVQKPSVSKTGKLDNATLQALELLNKVAIEIKALSALGAIAKIKEGKLRDGASELFDAKSEISKIIKTDKLKEAEAWNYQKKKEYLNTTKYPPYFPKPWQAKNVGISVATQEQCSPDDDDEKFRSCETPYFNHFLMWGPDCPGCGINGADPRLLKIKNKYPEVFSYQQVKERMDNHMWHPVVPSPGFSPYVAPPPPGTEYYQDPHHPNTNEEGVRFFDAEDEKFYYEYLEAYKQFRDEFGDEAKEYNDKFFSKLPHKKVKARGKPPNEWSSQFYGRTEPLWPDGTMRPSADDLKKIIQERGLSVTSKVHNLAKQFKKTY